MVLKERNPLLHLNISFFIVPSRGQTKSKLQGSSELSRTVLKHLPVAIFLLNLFLAVENLLDSMGARIKFDLKVKQKKILNLKADLYFRSIRVLNFFLSLFNTFAVKFAML